MQPYLFVIQSIVIIGLLLSILWMKYGSKVTKWWQAWRKKPSKPRQMRPRSPRDCDACKIEHILGEPITGAVPPAWQDVKSARGRPKVYASEGYACMNPACLYYKITDQSIHALRRNGTRNPCEATAQWECGHCLKSRTAWFGTVQYRLKTPSTKVSLALHLSMKSMSTSDISEVLELREATLQRWLDRGGEHSQRLHKHLFKDLVSRHIQLDELVTKVRNRIKRVWLWTGIDVHSKLLLAWVVARTSRCQSIGSSSRKSLVTPGYSRLYP